MKSYAGLRAVAVVVGVVVVAVFGGFVGMGGEERWE